MKQEENYKRAEYYIKKEKQTMERLSEEQYREVIAEIKHSELPRKTQEFLIALVNEANKPNKKIIE